MPDLSLTCDCYTALVLVNESGKQLQPTATNSMMKLQNIIGEIRVVATDEKKKVAYIERQGKRLEVPQNPPAGAGLVVIDNKPYGTTGEVIGSAVFA